MQPEKNKQVAQYGVYVIIVFIVLASAIAGFYFYEFNKNGLKLSFQKDLSKISALQTEQINQLIIICLLLLAICILLFLVFYIYKKTNTKYQKSLLKARMEINRLEEHFNISVKYSTDILLLLDWHGQILRANDKAVDVYGYSNDELLVKNFNELTAEKYIPKIKKTWEKLTLEKETVYELIQQKKDGSSFVAEIKNCLIETDTAKTIHCTIRDITEKKVDLEKIKESERVYFTLLNNLPGIAYRCKNDVNWTMDFISEGCKKLTGYEVNDLIGNNEISFADLIYSSDQNMVWLQTQEALINKKQFGYEYRIVTKDNIIKWVNEIGLGVYDINGNLMFLEGFISDITERKNIEEKLIEIKNTFQKSFENAIIGKTFFGLDGKFINVNKAFCVMTGYSYEELINLNFIDIIHN
ncbi:MAG: PAS domain S-box protein [bacterium]